MVSAGRRPVNGHIPVGSHHGRPVQSSTGNLGKSRNSAQNTTNYAGAPERIRLKPLRIIESYEIQPNTRIIINLLGGSKFDLCFQ